MKENKGKNVASGTEQEEEDVQVQDEPTPLIVQKFAIQATTRKRKSVSSSIDLGNLPRHRNHKKQKSYKTPPPKVSKSQDAMVDLDGQAVNLVPPQTSPLVIYPENPTPPTAKVPHIIHPSILTKRPPNLVLDEDHAQKTFKGIISKREVSAMLRHVNERL